MANTLTKASVAKMLDATLLDMTAEAAAFGQFLRDVKELRPATACVQPCRVAEAAAFLAGTGIGVASVVAFPAGGSVSETKAAEAARAVADGATELDMVVNLAAVRKLDQGAVVADIGAVVDAAAGRPVKVIVEAPLLSEEEKGLVCRAIAEAGAAFIKTCTGVASNFADPADIAIFRKLLPDRVSIKASGKVGTPERLAELHAAGARRFGVLASQARDILAGCPEG